MQRIILLCTVFFLISGPAAADSIQLKNGDRVSGEIIDQGRGGLFLQTTYGAHLTIPWSMVLSVQNTTGEPGIPVPPAATAPAPAPTQKRLLPVMIPSHNTAPPAITKADPVKIDSPATPEKRYSAEMNIGARLENGNSDDTEYHIDGAWRYKKNKNRYKAAAKAEQEKDGDTTTNAEAELDLAYDRFLTDKWFWNTALGLEHDDQEDLRLRTQISTGPGYQFFEGDDLNLSATVGVDYSHDEFFNDDTEEAVSGRWAVDYDQKIYNKKLKLFHSHDGVLSTEDVEDFTFDSKTGLKVLISKHLTSTLQVEFDYDNLPAAGVGHSDTSYELLLGYEW